MIRITCLSLLMMLALFSAGQNKRQDRLTGEQAKDFENFLKRSEQDFEKYTDSLDKDFSDYLRKEWKEFEVFSGIKPDSTPKPKKEPVFDPGDLRGRTVGSVEIKALPAPSYASSATYSSASAPEIRTGESNENTASVNFDFYGAYVEFNYDPAISAVTLKEIHNTSIADFWDRINQTSVTGLLQQFSDARSSMNLNDWGMYQLIRQTAWAINPDSNYSCLLSWFFLTRSGYRTRVAYNENRTFLMFPCSNTLYDVRFFMTDNMRYYAPDCNEKSILTYSKDFPGATRVLDVNLATPLNIGETIETRDVKFSYAEKEYSFRFSFNKNSVEFFKDYPQCDLKVYFDGVVSPQTKQSLYTALKPILDTLGKEDAAGFLLALVQKGFAYQDDMVQFGREKFQFPEEQLFYHYSDCDDRAVLYSYLVKELLGLKVIGLTYPGHVATAVHFTEGDPAGEFTMFKGEKYIIADPTFVNAPLGVSMPGMAQSKTEIVELCNFQNRDSQSESIWEKINSGGGYAGDNIQNSVTDEEGNVYVTGYYAGYADLNGNTLSSRDSAENVFVAAYNKTGNLLWVIKGTDDASGKGCNINLSPENELYVSGTFRDVMAFGEFNIIFSKDKPGLFLLKLNRQGEVSWLRQVEYKQDEQDSDRILCAKYSAYGVLLRMKIYPFDPNYSGYGIRFDEEGNISYNVSFASTLSPGIASVSLSSEMGFDVVSFLRDETEKQLSANCQKAIAGLFGAIGLLRFNGLAVSGQTVQNAFEKYNPGFKKKAPKIYDCIGKMETIRNSNGIVKIHTSGEKSVLLDKIKILDDCTFKIIILANGDARIDIMNGVKVGKAIVWFNLNYIRLFRNNGNVLFDYDTDHSQITMNLEKDILF